MIKKLNKLIIVAHASTGTGHTIAAKAIAADIKMRYKNVAVELVDILDYFPNEKTGNNFVSYTSGFFAPLYDFSWRKNFTGRILWAGGNLWPSFVYKKFEDYLIEKSPDAIVCTHQVCANVAAKARFKADKKFPIVSVPTDFETEGLWPHKQTDLFCVANTEMALTLISRHVPKNKILVSGMPVYSKYCKNQSKFAIREKLGLPKDKKIAIIIAGSSEPGPYKNIRKCINGAIKYFANMNWMHFIFCCGKDNEYAKKIMKKCNHENAENISVMTYTENLNLIMQASDIALIKPGGLILAECIASNLPILLCGKTYAQENINRRYLTAIGAAEHAVTSKGIVNLLNEILFDKNRYRNLRSNLRSIQKNDSCKLISNAIINLMKNYEFDNAKYSCLYIGNTPAHTR